MALYEQIYELARRCLLDGLARAAAKIIARMTDENLETPAKALERATAFAGEIGDSPSLQDGRARILVNAGNDAAALDLWRSALPNWRTDEADIAPSLSYRAAAVAAERLGLWGEAADLFAVGAERMAVSQQPAFRTGMLVDSGFASWKAGDNARALSSFAAGLRELDSLRADADSDPVYTVQKRAGHTLMWVQTATSGRPPDKFSEPPPGCCSNLEPMEGERPPQTPMDFILGHLIEFEQATGIGDEQLRMYVERLKTSPYALVRLKMLELIVRSRLSRLDMSGYLKDVIALVRALAQSKEIYANGGGDGYSQVPADAVPTLAADHHDVGRTYAIYGMFALAARGVIDRTFIEAWRREVADSNIGEVFDAWLDLVDGLFVSGQIEASAKVRQRNIDWTAQCLAAIRLTIDHGTEPNLLIQCHGLWLHYFGKLPNRDLIGPDVARLVATAWERCADRPFMLHTPGTSVPTLREAIARPEQGWARVRGIVGAALNAVRYDVGSTARDALSKFPD